MSELKLRPPKNQSLSSSSIRRLESNWRKSRKYAKSTRPFGLTLSSPLPLGQTSQPTGLAAIVANWPDGSFAKAGTVAEGSVVISPRGVERLRAGHLWVYRSDVRQAQAEAGAVVRLTDERGRFHGRAFYSDKSQIAVRLLTAEDVPVDRAFFEGRLRRAADYRKLVVEDTDAYRVVYSEADQLPSLIVDKYGDYLVVQTLSQSTDRYKEVIVDILGEIFSPKGHFGAERSESEDARRARPAGERAARRNSLPEILAKENGVSFVYDLAKGQKTGSFSGPARKSFGGAAVCVRRSAGLL